jgi:hypothetical protein
MEIMKNQKEIECKYGRGIGKKLEKVPSGCLRSLEKVEKIKHVHFPSFIFKSYLYLNKFSTTECDFMQ